MTPAGETSLKPEPLTEESLQADPVRQFDRWLKEAEQQGTMHYPEAACLSTLGVDGYPEGRIVLLKFYDREGFMFYSNSESPKGQSLRSLGRAALTFYWDALRRQVRIQGTVVSVSPTEADAYFRSRPRRAQLGAWASQQSKPLENRTVLEHCLEEWSKRFEARPVPRPPHWSGYRLVPARFEFWQEGADRLHDRFLFVQQKEDDWDASRLYP